MFIPLLLMWSCVTSGVYSVTISDHCESSKTINDLNDLCGTHTFQSVKPILNYVDQLQREQLIYDDERKETNKLRAKVQELEVKLAEGKLNEKLILSQDTHIKDLQTTIAELRSTNGLITTEIAQLKTFIQEKFNEEHSKINSSASKLRYCEDQLVKNNKTVAEYAAQLKSKEESLQSCELRLNETQNVVSECKVQLENQNKTIARKTATISQLEKDNERKDQTLKNIQKKLKANQEELQKQKKITDITVSQYAAQLKSKEESLQSFEFRLNKSQNVVSECKHQLKNQNETIARNTATISKLQADIERQDQTLKNTEANLEVNQDELQKQKKITDKTVSQLKSKEDSLQSCELRFNETQNVVSECKVQLEYQNETIALNTATISKLRADIERKDQTMKNTEANLEVNQEELQKQKKITEQMREEVTKLKEQIREKEEKPTGCTSFGDSNVDNIKIPNFEAFPVLCNSEIAGPGWTVIQQRIDGKENFYRNWKDYKNGFGQFSGDFFLGLEKIHRLTNNTPHELYIHMEGFKGGHYDTLSFHARYDNFRIAGEDDKYRLLSLGTYSGNAGRDRIRYHEHAQFSTFDSENDKLSNGNCAIEGHAGWWYTSCGYCNLNGKYYQEEVDKFDSNWWYPWNSLKTIKMLIRPRGN